MAPIRAGPTPLKNSGNIPSAWNADRTECEKLFRFLSVRR
jgi:hypothetical protein